MAAASVVNYELISLPVAEGAGSVEVIFRITADVDTPDVCDIAGGISSVELSDESVANATEGADFGTLEDFFSDSLSSGIGPFTQDFTFSMSIIPDSLVEPVNEQFGLTFESFQGSGELCFGEAVPSGISITSTIIDDDALQFTYTPATLSQAEDSGFVDVELELVNPNDAPSSFLATVPTSAASGTAFAGNDFTPAAEDLTFFGAEPASFTVALIDDSVFEPDETFSIGNNTPASAMDESGFALLVQVTNSVVVTIVDDQTPDEISFLNPTFTFIENATVVDIPVVRASSLQGDASVSYTTSNGSAVAGADFQANSGTLTFPSGDAVGETITLTLIDDNAHELPEAFSIVLSNPVNAVLGSQATTTITISDNDTDDLGFAVANASVDEASGTVTLDVLRVGTAVDAISVSYATSSGTATAGADFTNTTGTLSFPAGEFGPLSISVPVSADVIDEPDEAFDLVLSAPVGAATLTTSTATITILDDDDPDTINIVTRALTVAENVPSAEISVLRSGSLVGPVSVSYTTTDGTANAGGDFQVASGTLNFADGEAGPLVVTIVLVDDAVHELDESFDFALSAPVNADIGAGSAVINITDDDTDDLGFAIVSTSVDESASSVSIDVVRTGAALEAISVAYGTTAGTATADADYTTTSGTLSFLAGEFGPLTIDVPIVDDPTDEPDETFDLVLSAPVGPVTLTTSTISVAILDNDDPLAPTTYQFNSVNVDALEEDGDVGLQVTRAGDLSLTGSVDYATQDGTATVGADYVASSGTLTFAPGEAGPVAVVVQLVDDADPESLESFDVALANAVGGSIDLSAGVASIAIEDNDVAADELGFVLAAQSVDESAGSVTIDVLRTGAALEEISVTYATLADTAIADTDFSNTSGTLTFPAGELGPLTIDVPISDDTLEEENETFSLVLSDPAGSVNLTTSTSVISIVDDDEPPAPSTYQFFAVSLSAAEGDGDIEFQVTRSGDLTVAGSVGYEAVDGTAVVGADYLAQSGTLEFAAGDAGPLTFLVNVVDDAVNENSESLSVILSNPVGGSVDSAASVAVLTIEDDDAIAGPPVEGELVFPSGDLDITEDSGDVVISVSRQGGTVGQVSVDYSAVPGTATAGDDYILVPGSLVWADGEGGERSFTLTVIDDGVVENTESFSVELGNFVANVGVSASSLRRAVSAASANTIANSVIGPRRLGTPSTIVITLEDTGLAVPDSSISFVSDSVTVDEADGTVDIEVARSGAPVGLVSIDWSTLADSAEEDGDFVAASGTLVWPDGDDTNKVISVELRSDIDIEGVEEFSIELSNPQGASVGDTAEAVVSISDVGRDLADVPGLSVEEREFATALDNSCDGLIANGDLNTVDQQDLLFICGTVRNGLENTEQVVEALDALSGDELITAATSTLKLLGLQHNTFRNRLQGLRSGNADSIDVAGLAVEIDGQYISGAVLEELFGALTGGAASGDDGAFGRLSFYVNGKLEFGEKDRDSENRGYDFDAQMLTLGADFRLNDNFFLGGAFGYEMADVKFAQGGRLDVGGWKGSIYGSYFSGESFYIDAQASYGKDDYESERRISYDYVGGSIDRTAEGATTGDQFATGIGSGFDFNKGRLTFGPNAALSYFDVGVKSFSESGAGGLNLDIGRQQQQSLTLTAGAHLSYVFNTKIGVLIPNARIDYIHEFMTAPEFSNVRFSADPFGDDPSAVTAPLNVQAETIDQNYMLWSVGTSAQFVRGLSGYVNFQSTEGYTGLTLRQVSFGFRYERAF